MSKKIRLGILFGGKSAEHEVSLASAKSIVDALDKSKYEIALIGIDKEGSWHYRNVESYLMHAEDPKQIRLHGEKELVHFSGDQLQPSAPLDVIFPVLHGTHGEDGTVQGLLKLANIPFVGADVLGSAVGMDKDVMKRLLRDAKIPIPRFLTVHLRDKTHLCFEQIVAELGLPFFVKPANAGSSVGIAKVKQESDFLPAIEGAFAHDRKILIEEAIVGREIECAVLGNDHPIASLPGEIIPLREFYSYEAKYIDAEGARLEFPANLSEELIAKVQKMAIEVYQVLCVEGMARIDFFLKDNGELLLNEINTIPGFTKISMYPKLWEVSGLPYPDLLDRLIELALERHHRQ
ncbi:MAG: D-alanine--D-alanine ligase [Verrucomicrobia bacterium]|nr:D-alanine--D-alanine ligase [Verrucomicrobiota bacterium]